MVYLHWNDRLPDLGGGNNGPRRYAAYNSLHEALEQAVCDDGLTAVRITSDEAGDDVLASKAAIAEYAKAKAAAEAKRDAKVAAAHEEHLKALAAAAG